MPAYGNLVLPGYLHDMADLPEALFPGLDYINVYWTSRHSFSDTNIRTGAEPLVQVLAQSLY